MFLSSIYSGTKQRAVLPLRGIINLASNPFYISKFLGTRRKNVNRQFKEVELCFTFGNYATADMPNIIVKVVLAISYAIGDIKDQIDQIDKDERQDQYRMYELLVYRFLAPNQAQIDRQAEQDTIVLDQGQKSLSEYVDKARKVFKLALKKEDIIISCFTRGLRQGIEVKRTLINRI